MGTDINIVVDARYVDRTGAKTGWVPVVPPPGLCDSRGVPQYDRRNYPLFSFLSDVRYGCAAPGQIPHRGLPPDCDPHAQRMRFYNIALSGVAWFGAERYSVEDAATWATVDELLKLPWDEVKSNWLAYKDITMAEQCPEFLHWLHVLNNTWGRENCRVIWGFDS